ncbi:hypothetical protein JKP22_20095 [Vibrio vulnificus]|uniref:hypothetical protein n=1 Tax=Vibrio TaxID=662 RepID=UPI000CD01A62|nr:MULTISPECIES: hypothetical protein [Vibrio]EGQ7990751.1 hypothetical protein [Vibrio vulnificus]EGR0107082.1 hypothetical protein [Vibrio vulnificus]EGR7943991.1 hypothetical protein [Vibrio vulnificus]EHU9455718.1 hypothetical protein [Vibrio vulnificus]EHV9837625.1 hypothetical protein [Vibrio vulnificus]
MNIASKLNTLLAVLLASLILLLVYLNNMFHPSFLEGRNNTLLFSHGVTYSESGVEKYREFHTLDHKWSGMHKLHTTYGAEDDSISLNVSSSVYFWTSSLFSTSSTVYSEFYTASVEPDATQAHLLLESADEYFQTIYQDSDNFCYSSLLTGSVQCVTAGR